MPDAREKFRSVTEIDSPVEVIGPLEPELLAAFNIAAAMVRAAQTVVMATSSNLTHGGWSSDEGGRRRSQISLVTMAEESIHREHPFRTAVLRVFNPLARASEPAARFGEPSAHSAALAVADQVQREIWMGAAPLQGLNPERLDTALIGQHFERVCLSVAQNDWPDFTAMRVAIQLEAAKASIGPKPRLELDEGSQSVWLDDKLVASELPQEQYYLLKAVASGLGAQVSGGELADGPVGYAGKKWKRDVIDRMPPTIKSLIVATPGAGGGYSLRLPPVPRKKTLNP